MKMAESATYGFMIWNGQSKGTLNNVINLTKNNKKTLVYFAPNNKFYCVHKLVDFDSIIDQCDIKTNELFKDLVNKTTQLSFLDD